MNARLENQVLLAFLFIIEFERVFFDQKVIKTFRWINCHRFTPEHVFRCSFRLQRMSNWGLIRSCCKFFLLIKFIIISGDSQVYEITSQYFLVGDVVSLGKIGIAVKIETENTTEGQSIMKIKLLIKIQMFQYTNSFYQSGRKNTDKRELSKQKSMAIEDIVPIINIPKPKRAAQKHKGDNEDKSRKKTINQEEILETLFKDNILSKKQKKEQEETRNDFSFKFAQISEANKKKYLQIIQMLSFIFSEFETKKQEYTTLKIYELWEANEILNNTKDSNLGDFIIKLPNPDCMPQEQHEATLKKQTLNMFEALEYYDDLFRTDEQKDKNRQFREKSAFIVSFYLLDLKGGVRAFQLEKVKKEGDKFLGELAYFDQICPLNYQAYVQMHREESFIRLEKRLDPFFEAQRKYIQAKKKKERPNQFYNYKKKIYERLSSKISNKHLKFDQEKTLLSDPFIAYILNNVPSFCTLFRHLPKFFEDILQESRYQYQYIYRKLCYGGGMQKVSKNGQLRWILVDKRPKDVLTLLRRMLMYKLTRRGGLFTRSFLSQNENYIFIVVKATEQHLQKMAQNNNIQMELEFGSIDLFAFEPVDVYLRPLRINPYIKDPGFYRKYNLSVDKTDKDENICEKSIESESRNLYKKAQQMNEEQLRVKIILDQEECDEKYRWVSKTLSIKYIKGDETLVNQYNKNNIEKQVWPVYYVYNKLIIQGIHRIKQVYDSKNDNSEIQKIFRKNIGLILRLLFLKALNVANDLYYQHRKQAFRSFKNIYRSEKVLKNLWNKLGEDFPRGYSTYFYSQKFDKMWRKYQINENKDRSKFMPSARILITDQIITELVNISKAKLQTLVTDYYPIHDPYILKNIRIQPYLNVLENMVAEKDIVPKDQQQLENSMRNMFTEFECQYTSEDFTKDSVYEKLGFKLGKINDFSVMTVAFYCGDKLAFYFELRRFLMKKAFPFIIPTLILQILFWVEKAHVEQKGSSRLQPVNSVFMIMLGIFNIFWVDQTINEWKQREKNLARAFGTSNQATHEKKRVMFQGQFYRNLQTDEMNDEKVSSGFNVIKNIITLAFNFSYIVLLAATLLLIFVFKGIIYQQGASQSAVTYAPAILISLTVHFYNFLYSKLIRFIVDFENNRSVSEYQESLSSKNFVITFIVTYFCLFLYAFFSSYLTGSNVCLVKTQDGAEITDCYFYVSSQLITSAVVDLITTILFAFFPYMMFKFRTYQMNKQKKVGITFNGNYFESFDQYYEEEDRMQSFMYNDEIDNTWLQFTIVIISFTTLALFGPVVPFLYPMIFLISLVSLHSKKYEIVYLSKRTIPTKVSSIGKNWVQILRIIGILGVFSNIALILYVRNAFEIQNKTVVFLAIAFPILVIKYLLSQVTSKKDIVGERSKSKARDLISERGLFSFNTDPRSINTDIQNVFYDETKLKRNLPKLHQALVKVKK